MPYSVAENESIGLCIALEAIDEMANHAMLMLSDPESSPGQAEVRFPSRTHQGLFLSRLLDFAHETASPELTGINGSCLSVLEAACTTRSFEYNGSAASLAVATQSLRTWLDTKTAVRLWLPTLDIDALLDLPRIELLHISGNQAKHNLARLTAVAKRVAHILKAHGYNPPLQLITHSGRHR